MANSNLLALDPDHGWFKSVPNASEVDGSTSARMLVSQSSAAPAFVAMSGDATMTAAGVVTIAAGAVEQSMLAASASAPVVVADPGDGEAIPVTQSASIAITTGGSGETNTLAIPTFQGQTLDLFHDTDGGGNRVITSAQAINAAGNTTMTFGDAGDFIILRAITVGGALRWRIVENEGVTLA